MSEQVTSGIGKTIPKQIRLADGITPSSAFLPTDELTCILWKGDQESALATPQVYWNPDLGPPDFMIDLQPADTANLTPAVYSIGVGVFRPSTGQTARIWQSQIEVLAKAGTALSQPVYIQLSDLVTEMPSISDYQQQFRDETGFEAQRAKARKKLDEACHRNVRGMAGITSSVYPSDYPYRYLVKSPTLQRYLDLNYLWITPPMIDHQVFLTLGMIFGGQLISNPDVYSKIANGYNVRADLALRGCTAQVMGPQNDGTGAGTGTGSLLCLIEFSSSKMLRA